MIAIWNRCATAGSALVIKEIVRNQSAVQNASFLLHAGSLRNIFVAFQPKTVIARTASSPRLIELNCKGRSLLTTRPNYTYNLLVMRDRTNGSVVKTFARACLHRKC